jgi:hypothetical protein
VIVYILGPLTGSIFAALFFRYVSVVVPIGGENPLVTSKRLGSLIKSNKGSMVEEKGSAIQRISNQTNVSNDKNIGKFDCI